MENSASEGWVTLVNALNYGPNFIQKFQHCGVTDECVQHGGTAFSAAPSEENLLASLVRNNAQLLKAKVSSMKLQESAYDKMLNQAQTATDEFQQHMRQHARTLSVSVRLESLYSEGAHRLSEICCLAVEVLLWGKSIISTQITSQGGIYDEDINQKLCQLISDSMQRFITGLSDVTETCIAAINNFTIANAHEQPSVQVLGALYSNHLYAIAVFCSTVIEVTYHRIE